MPKEVRTNDIKPVQVFIRIPEGSNQAGIQQPDGTRYDLDRKQMVLVNQGCLAHVASYRSNIDETSM